MKTTITNQLVKNLPTLTRDKKKNPKDWKWNSNVALRFKKFDANKRFAIMVNKKYYWHSCFYSSEVCSW